MPIPTNIADLSQTAASNSPAGSDNIAPDLDDHIRVHASFIARLRDGTGYTSPYLLLTGGTTTGAVSVGGNFTAGSSSGHTMTVHPSAVTWVNNPTHSGNHTFSGNVTLGSSSGNAVTITAATVNCANGLNFDAGTLVIDASNNRVGFGVTPAVRMHAYGSGEIARMETTATRGAGNNYQAWHDPTGRKGYIGYGSGSNDGLTLSNEMAAETTFYTAGTRYLHANTSGEVGVGPGVSASTGYGLTTNRINVDGSGTWGRFHTSASAGSGYLPFYSASTLRGYIGNGGGGIAGGADTDFGIRSEGDAVVYGGAGANLLKVGSSAGVGTLNSAQLAVDPGSNTAAFHVGSFVTGTATGSAITSSGSTVALDASNYFSTLNGNGTYTNIQYGTWRCLGFVSGYFALWFRVA